MKQTKTTEPEWHQALAPLQSYVEANRNGVAEIVARLNRRTKRVYGRAHIGQYFIRARARRTEPKLGLGLLLIAVGKEIANARAPVMEAPAGDRNDNP